MKIPYPALHIPSRSKKITRYLCKKLSVILLNMNGTADDFPKLNDEVEFS